MPLPLPLPLLSVLDPTIVPSGLTPADTVAASVELARHAERLGYARLWVTEHHNHPALAKGTPLLYTLYLAARTRRIRVGAGGVMLPNHAPLAVAEEAALLGALHPGRVDLGVGRAPGADPATAHALSRGTPFAHERRLDDLAELLGLPGTGGGTRRGPRTGVRAVPVGAPPPELWILGSSPYSALLAAERGLPYAFAHHFGGPGTTTVPRLYRERFRPSAALSRPYTLVTANVVAADTEAEARRQAASQVLTFQSYHEHRPDILLPPETAAERLARTRGDYPATVLSGTAGRVKDELDRLARVTGADEIMVNTTVHDQRARLRSYALLADAYGLRPAPLAPNGALAA
ncbi:LLM class flavin-dependent oxidoreductase [Streptomyces sp. NPDC048659]|uniref:LLM class flavin-dependent oxidoreductase n=1 Tax=Streptomyces sp. NPDC048659 TaxID=3155489 RepID=UPI00342771F2